MTNMIKELFNEAEEMAQMEKDFEMMKQDGTYDILFPEPTEEDLEAMYLASMENEEIDDDGDFFIPEPEDIRKTEKEMGEIPL